MDLVCTEEMKQLLTSPIIKETKPVTNGTTNQQAMDSGIHSDALYQRFSLPPLCIQRCYGSPSIILLC